jgi:hypothetical protein
VKKIAFLILCTCSFIGAAAQTDTSKIYLRFPSIPPFSLVKIPDSSILKREDLTDNKATVFIIFNPFCDHCKHGIKSITDNIDKFKNIQVVLASPIEWKYLKPFYYECKLTDYPDIVMGRDPSNFFGTFFNISSVPGVFVYDKKGNFVTSFEKTVPVEDILKSL